MLSDQLATRFDAKKEELDTNPGSRTYCFRQKCQAFIGANNIVNEVATCSSCNSSTCKTCKAALHEGDCPKDEALQQTLELAREQEWSRCRECGRIVELVFGCHHMTYLP